MLKPTILALLLIASAAASIPARAQQTPKIETTNVQPTSPVSGPQMYTTYCAVCHGVDGTGNGPAAQALKTPPADLTTLTRRHGGSFPSTHVAYLLKAGIENSAHGSAQMPIWGDAFRTNDALLRLRILNLTNYLKQMQK